LSYKPVHHLHDEKRPRGHAGARARPCFPGCDSSEPQTSSSAFAIFGV